MTTFINGKKASVAVMVLILTGSLQFSGCSLVGIAGGLAIDSAHRNKNDKISSESQRIVLRYKDGNTVRGVYKGLEYVPSDSIYQIPARDSLPPEAFVSFPNIGEQISLELLSDTLVNEGSFSGIVQSDTTYHFMLQTESDQPYNLIPFNQILSIRKENGEILSDIPDTNCIYLLYELNDEILRVPLAELNHIHYKATNNVLTLGAAGLVIDTIILVSVSQSLSDLESGW